MFLAGHSYIAWSLRLVIRRCFIYFCASVDSIKTMPECTIGFRIWGHGGKEDPICSTVLGLWHYICPAITITGNDDLAWPDLTLLHVQESSFGVYLSQLSDMLVFIFWQEQPSHFWFHHFLNLHFACCLGQKALGKLTKETKYSSWL